MANLNMNGDDQEFIEIINQLDENPSIPQVHIDPKLLNLQKEVAEFVTSVILNHEIEFYQLVQRVFPAKLEDLLCSTGPSIIQMIVETTNKFYNKIYYDIQHKNETLLTKSILQMCSLADYGPHILLDKLLRLTLEIHLGIDREELDLIDVNSNSYYISKNRQLTKGELKSNPLDFYQRSVLSQINCNLQTKNLVHIMSKGEDDDTEFVEIPEGEYAFNIVLDKNIGPS